MKAKLASLSLPLAVGMFFNFGLALTTAVGQGTAFLYQGRLNDGAVAATGSYDLRFAIFDSSTAGVQQGPILTNSATAVSNGLFTAMLDFGNQFAGANRWLEIAVRTNGGIAFTTLTPRQPLTPAPYAVFANTASNLTGTITAAQLPSTTVVNTGTNSGAASTAIGGFTTASGAYSTAMGSGTTATNFASTAMGSTTTAGGTGSTAMGIFSIASGTASTAMGSGAYASGVHSVAMGDFTTASGIDSTAMGYNTTASGPYSTAMGDGASASGTNSIAMGLSTVATNSGATAIGNGSAAFGYSSTALGYATTASGPYSAAMGLGTIAGGAGATAIGDQNQALGDVSTAMGYTTMASGFTSTAMGNSTIASGNAAVAMGNGNVASGDFSLAAGYSSQAAHSGAFVWADPSTTAIFTSTASNQFLIRATGGVGINTNNPTGAALAVNGMATINGVMGIGTSVAGKPLVVQKRSATEPAIMVGGGLPGGARIQTYGLDVDPKAWMGLGSDMGGGPYEHSLYFPVGNNNGKFTVGSYDGTNYSTKLTVDINGNIRWGNGSLLSSDANGIIELGSPNSAAQQPIIDFHFGVGSVQDYNVRIINDINENLSIFRLSSGTPMARFNSAGLTVNGTFVSSSDRNAKENFKPISAETVLEKVVALPISQWNYKDDKASEHIGPMAQDFYAAFNVGPDDKHITTVDEGGVALAAIQGLNQKLEETRAENAELKQQLAELRQLVQTLVPRH